MHAVISTITHLTTFSGSLTHTHTYTLEHTFSLIPLSNSDQLANIASLRPSPTPFCPYSLFHTHTYTHQRTFTHWVLHLIHLGRGKQALPTTILVSMATANQVMSLIWPASKIPGDKKEKRLDAWERDLKRERNYLGATWQCLRSKGKDSFAECGCQVSI